MSTLMNVTSETKFNGNSEDVNNSDDATWILTSAFIIFTMQSGFGLLESGLVSQKNEVNIMVKNAIDVIFGGLAYWIFGFAFSFGKETGSNGFSGFGMFLTDADEKKMGSVFAKYFFQLSFATTATTIVSGALAERTNLKAYMAFSFFNTFTYCFPAHWIWANNGWLKKLGAIDIAGSSAVHIVGGSSGLVATLYLGPRNGRFIKNRAKTEPFTTMASPTSVVLGTFMLWWGWLGFNCGSTFGISGRKWKLAARSAVCTINSSIGGGICGIFYSYIFCKNKLRIEEFVTGILGGLVAVTAICTVTKPWESLVIGAIGGIIACTGCHLLKRLRIDDPVGCVPVHFFSGVWSLIAVAAFVEKDLAKQTDIGEGIMNESRWRLLGVQIALAICCSAWAASITLLLLVVINIFTPVRMSLEDEIRGADFIVHGIKTSPDSYRFGSRKQQSQSTSFKSLDETNAARLSSNEASSANRRCNICETGQNYALLDLNELKNFPICPEGHMIIRLQKSSSTHHVLATIEDNCPTDNSGKDQPGNPFCQICSGKAGSKEFRNQDSVLGRDNLSTRF